MRDGRFGDHKHLQDGVQELRIDRGPGYRVYFAIDGKTIVLLLGGGDKGSQERDIQRAVEAWFDYETRTSDEQAVSTP